MEKQNNFFFFYTLLGTKRKRGYKAPILGNETSLKETYLLGVFVHTRHINTKKAWKAPYMGIENNFTKNITKTVFSLFSSLLVSNRQKCMQNSLFWVTKRHY